MEYSVGKIEISSQERDFLSGGEQGSRKFPVLLQQLSENKRRYPAMVLDLKVSIAASGGQTKRLGILSFVEKKQTTK